MCCEDSTSEQVGLAHVVQEAADVSIETGIDAVLILRLERKTPERLFVTFQFDALGFSLRDQHEIEN